MKRKSQSRVAGVPKGFKVGGFIKQIKQGDRKAVSPKKRRKK